MDEKMKEIEERWPFLFPLDHSRGLLADAVKDANLDISYLLQKVKELRTRVAELEEWCGAFKDI